MSLLSFLLVLLFSAPIPAPLYVPDAVAGTRYEQLKSQAERSYAEKSFAQAHELYEQAAKTDVPAAERRWVDFRLADTAWRGAPESADTTVTDKAREQLEAIASDANHDRIWAEAQESLGDFWWTAQGRANFGGAIPHYNEALSWWAASSDLDQARKRYLRIVWRLAEPPWRGGSDMTYIVNQIPVQVLENAVSIATAPDDRARAHYLLASRLRSDGRPESQDRVSEEYESALQGGRATGWYDDALFQYAQWLERYGRVVVLSSGETTRQVDYDKALELYRRIVSEYSEGQTRYWRPSKEAIDRITTPWVQLSVSNVFLPGSEIALQLAWRNAKRIDLSITRVDLPQDVHAGPKWNPTNWSESLRATGRAPLRSWTRTPDTPPHQPAADRLILDEKLPIGAYVIDARTEGATARELILVTDLAIVTKSSPGGILVFACDAESGAPVPGARILVDRHRYENDAVIEQRGETGADGVATVPGLGNGTSDFVVFAAKGDRQAISNGWSNGYDSSDAEPWKIYAFTDRPAYRPGEEVHWKYSARRTMNGVYQTPVGPALRYEIIDPRGAKVAEGSPRLNGFGSAWGNLALNDTMPLGAYRIVFYVKDNQIGDDTLFRLEEYKLPEFKVSVVTPEKDGKKKSFRLGETVEADIEAEYFFGGPVANAAVEVVVHQQPLYHTWYEPVDFPWLRKDEAAQRYYGGDQIARRFTTTTDAAGRAHVSFPTPVSGGDLLYRIEARVTDASRREIEGGGEVSVTAHRYSVHTAARHSIHRPGEKAVIDFTAVDANDQPVKATGNVTITRDHWFEIWLDPDNREVRGTDLEQARSRAVIFPPPPESADRRWRLKTRGYTHDDVLKTVVSTDANGKGELTFTPAQEGFYRIVWTSDDEHPESAAPPSAARNLVQAETSIWVATGSSTELGYRHDGVEIIIDRNSVREGQTTPVMIVTPASGRNVLFAVESDRIDSYRVLHLDGTVKLIDLPIEDKFVPNVFLSASSVYDHQLSLDEKQLDVPPVKHFLNVDVSSDRGELRPRQDGQLTIFTRDVDGNPVAAEVALGVVDESVFSIQKPLALDPREFFFAQQRGHLVQTTSSFQNRAYVRLAKGEDGSLIDDATRERKDFGGLRDEKKMSADRMMAKSEMDFAGGIVSNAPAAMPAPAMMSQGKVAEAITVTAASAAVQEGAVEVRSDFRSTMFWQPDVMTGLDGRATVALHYPDSLTTWRATATAITAGTQVGRGETSTKTSKPLIVRLEGPRFLVAGDKAVISAVMNNNTDQALRVTPTIDASGIEVDRSAAPVAAITVPAHGEARADWPVSASRSGSARMKVIARAEGSALDDAMEKEMPVYEHGIEKLLARSGKVRSSEAVIAVDLPAERRAGSTSLVVQASPSIAVTLLDALPYLIDYPYGCTEQTMSRFLPAAIVARTLRKLGVDAELVAQRSFGGIEQTSVNATHPEGKHIERLDSAIRKGMLRLYDFQHDDGGWGWWKQGESDIFMTAYVVWGFAVARDGGIDVRTNEIDRAAESLDKRLVERETDVNDQAWILHALSAWRGAAQRNALESKALDNVWASREKLTPYSRALFALALQQFGDHDRALVLVRNLENGVKIDRTPDQSVLLSSAQSTPAETMATAHWGEDRFWWRWYDGPVESTAFALRALMAIDPENRLVEPVMNWLVKNRRGAQWNNTRDTAIAVLALNDYLRQSGELSASGGFEVTVNGASVGHTSFTPADLLRAPSRFTVDPKLLRNGVNEVHVRRTGGSGAIYFSTEARFFSLEEPIRAAGNEIFVRRTYERLVGRPTLLKGYVYDKVTMRDRETIISGDRVEVVLTVETKNDYDYLMFEDLKPAGLEAVELTSGADVVAQEIKSGALAGRLEPQARSGSLPPASEPFTGRAVSVYRELRDRKVALFIDHLPQGVWEIRYSLRAEVPGAFHALPVVGQAMYVPEIRANGEEVRMTVEERR